MRAYIKDYRENIWFARFHWKMSANFGYDEIGGSRGSLY